MEPAAVKESDQIEDHSRGHVQFLKNNKSDITIEDILEVMNWFEAKTKISLGAVEGLNNKAKVVTRKSYGFKTAEILKIMLYHKLGKLPVPELAHKYF